jgi:hypothetical protein
LSVLSSQFSVLSFEILGGGGVGCAVAESEIFAKWFWIVEGCEGTSEVGAPRLKAEN